MKKNRSRSFLSQRGFSLPEAILAAGLGLGLLTLGAMTYMKYAKSLARDSKVNKVVSLLRYFETVVRRDISSISTIKGKSASYEAGSTNGANGEFFVIAHDPPNIFDPNDRYDKFSLFSEKAGSISGPAFLENRGANGVYLHYITSGANLNTMDKFFQAGISNSYVILSNSDYRNIFKTTADATQSPSTCPSPHNTEYCVSVPILVPPSFALSEIKESGTEVRLVQKLSFFPKDSNSLTTDIVRRENDNPATDRVVLKDVAGLTVGYGFSNRNEKLRMTGAIYLPKDPIRSPLDSNYLSLVSQAGSGKRPVKWEDAEFVNMVASVVVGTTSDFKGEISSTGKSKFRVEGDNVIYDYRFMAKVGSIAGDGAGGMGSLVAGTNSKPECMDMRTARCNANCSSFFQDPSGPFWSAYGDPNSDVCQCGTRTGPQKQYWNSPDTAEGQALIPYWRDYNHPSAEHRQLEACARYTHCAQSWLYWWGPRPAGQPWTGGWDVRHPGCTLVNNCFHPTATGMKSLTDGAPDWSAISSYVAGNVDGASTNPGWMKCDGDPDGARNCDMYAGEYVSTTAIGGSNSYAADGKAWKNKCGCMIYSENADGTVGSRLWEGWGTQITWPKICAQGGTNSCTNTWDSNANAYRGKSASNPQGLVKDEAIMCQCRAETGQNNGDWGAWSQSFRVRAATDLPGSGTVYGTLPYVLTGGTYIDGNGVSQSLAGTNCALTTCNFYSVQRGMNSNNCCIASAHPTDPGGWPSLFSRARNDYRYYCAGNCNDNTGFYYEMMDVRQKVYTDFQNLSPPPTAQELQDFRNACWFPVPPGGGAEGGGSEL